MTDDERAIFEFSQNLMTRAFRELGLAFALVDREGADRAIHTIEADMARDLTAFCEKPPKGILIDRRALVPVVTPLRQMTQETRALIQKAGKREH